MNPFIPLEELRIREVLTSRGSMRQALHFHVLDDIDSTNRYLKEGAKRPEIQVCCAEKQSQGRGRFNRPWVSPFGENIYLSCRWQLKLPSESISVLSLVLALALLDGLELSLGHTSDVRIKWPNDLLWNDKKLSGILIEIVSEMNGVFDVVIGIGLNVNTDSKINPLTEKASCSLFDITGTLFDRNAIIAHILISLEKSIQLLQNSGFQAFESRWQSKDYLEGKFINVTQMGKRIEGLASGVNYLGQLRLVDESGVTHYLSSGDTSLSD